MKKKGIRLFIATFVMLLLVACGSGEKPSGSPTDGDSEPNTEENSAANNHVEKSNSQTSDQNRAESNENAETGDVEEDVFETSSDKENDVQSSGNLLDKNKVFKHNNGSVVMTLTKAEFTYKFGPSNARPEDHEAYRKITADSQIYLHLTGTIQNDTKDSVSFGHKLGLINFSLLYDGKHEFDGIGSAEEENSTKLGPSSIDALTEGKFHVYFQVPKPVSETNKPLILTVILGEEPFEITLR